MLVFNNECSLHSSQGPVSFIQDKIIHNWLNLPKAQFTWKIYIEEVG